MKLELKHLAGYLPYKVGVSVSGVNGELSIRVINFYTLENIKPILHPLSDLTKEIEVNGEKFVPSEKIAVHLFDFDFLAMVIDRRNTDGIPFWVIQKLYEWHFDIHNLIEQGLAIDINTLNK